MPECYEFEECEYNGQPRCYLPDGVDCPHGVGAGANEGERLMDIEKLIERLRNNNIENNCHDCALGYYAFEAATALSALRPVSREQVEKVQGEWIDLRECYNDVPKRQCSHCGKVLIGLETPFCEACGAPMTDEAVQMVMERLEALHETT